MGMCSFKCCGQCCGLLSVFGIFFLFSVGHMFASQPMFTDVEAWVDNHDGDAARNCYLGGVIYLCTLAASAACFLYDRKRASKRPPIHDAVATNFYSNANLGRTFNSSPGESQGLPMTL